MADDYNGLNSPLTRRGVVPFGADKEALTNALWLETDRRYRESASAVSYVRQDVATLSHRTGEPDFSAEPAEVYVQPLATLDFDKQKWIERLKRCSAKA